MQYFLLCDFIMNPLVCQPNDGPPTEEIHTSLCTFQQKLQQRGQEAYHSMSLVSLVNIHASSNSIIAAWQ